MGLKILHTESSLAWGGQEIRVLEESAALIARGHEVHLACPPEATICREAPRRGLVVHAVPVGRKRLGPLLAMRRVIADGRFDVVNTHSSTDSWLAAVACATLAGAPPIVRTRHVSTPLSKGPTTRWLYERANRCIVTTGEKLRRQLIDESGLTQVPIVSVPTGIDGDRFRPRDPAERRAALGLPVEAFIVGIVATLRSWKGHLFLLEAFASMRRPQDRLVIVGDGPMQSQIDAKIAELGLADAVVLAGRQDAPEDWMPAFDVSCLPSYANEGVPQSLIQSMMCGLPCVTTDVGAIGEIAQHERTGLIVPTRDAAAVAAALVRLRDDPALRARLGAAALEHVRSRYSRARMADAMEGIFQAVVAGRPIPGTGAADRVS